MKAFFGSIFFYFQRRPHSRLALVRLILYLGGAVAAKATLDVDTLYIIGAALLGVGDLAATAGGNTGTTPVGSPKLGAGKPMPPELKVAALAVQQFLPAPIAELWERYGELMWGLVDTARKRQLSEAEREKALAEQVAGR